MMRRLLIQRDNRNKIHGFMEKVKELSGKK
jgi:hypothetical protein